MESRILGPVELQGGAMDAVLPFAGTEIPLRLEIDFPEKFDESVVTKVDFALGSFGNLDTLARDAIAAALGRAGSAPAQLLISWRSNILFGSDDSPEAFTRALQPVHVTILPDGGSASLDRLVLLYATPEVPSSKIVVRLKEGVGPVLDPGLRN